MPDDAVAAGEAAKQPAARQVQHRLRHDRPKHDGPKEVGQYAELFNSPIIGLTGSPAQIDHVKKEFGIYAEPSPHPMAGQGDGAQRIVLLFDRDGKFVDDRLARRTGRGRARQAQAARPRLEPERLPLERDAPTGPIRRS